MKRSLSIIRYLVIFGFLLITVGLTVGQNVLAKNPADEIPLGAALYDNWINAKGVNAPEGNMPLWERQTTNTRSGADTWRCVTCHGWDYQGKDGAYRSGSNYTGFPGVFLAGKSMSRDEIIAQLSGKRDPSHDFTPYLEKSDQEALALFLTAALIDDNEFIDPVTLKVAGGDEDNGKMLYNQECASCHGEDGSKIQFRFEGTPANLGDLAAKDPWRFLHKTRFGTPGTPMVVGYDLGWTAETGRDVLKYAQSLPLNQSEGTTPPTLQDRPLETEKQPGGPAQSFFTSILTIISVMIAGLGINVLIGAGLVGIILLIVWVIRSRK